jgi:hypothetical protein
MKINQIINEGINEGLVFYAKNPDGTKTYSLVKDAEHLANLEQKYRGAQVQKLDFARQDVQDWLDSRGVNLRRFPPGMETTVGPNQGRPADAPAKPQNVVWRAPGYEPGKGSPFDTSGSTLVKRTNFPAKDDVMAEGDGDHQIRPGLKVSQGTVVKVDGNTVVVKTSNGDMMIMNIHDIDQGVAEGDLNEFAPAGRDPGGDDEEPGDDPYKYPKPEAYDRSIDFFGRFEADHFDDEEFDKATGVFKGYWDDEEGRVQIGYFKFDDPARTGSDDPGMGWYYEPQNESVAEGDTQLQPGMQVKDGTIVKVDGNTVTVKTSNGDLMTMNIHDVDVAQNMAEGKPKEKEADYGADYQDMVSRVKKLAGLGPLKTVYDPQKRVYKNVPKAEQPKK